MNRGELKAEAGAFLSTVTVDPGASLEVGSGAVVHDVRVHTGSHVKVLPGAFVRMATFNEVQQVSLGGMFADVEINGIGNSTLDDACIIHVRLLGKAVTPAGVGGIVVEGLVMTCMTVSLDQVAIEHMGRNATLVGQGLSTKLDIKSMFCTGVMMTDNTPLCRFSQFSSLDLHNVKLSLGDNLFLSGGNVRIDNMETLGQLNMKIGRDVRITAPAADCLLLEDTSVAIGDNATIVALLHYSGFTDMSLPGQREVEHMLNIPPGRVAAYLTSRSERLAIIETRAPDSGIMVF